MNAVATQSAKPFDGFRGELMSREDELASILPAHISREKFINTAIIAVKNNPDLLACERRSLHAAVTKAAEDGLQPDGREGVITWFYDKEKKAKIAQWNPMLYGIRKRARELCGMIIDAQVVYQHDTFDWHQGDDPRIEHKPAQLGEDRGKPIGAYAIFKQGDVILHREVMDADAIGQIKAISRAQGGPMWKTFWTEAWRKCPVRRGIKTVPSVTALERMVSRDDEHADLEKAGNVVALRAPVLEIPDIPETGEISNTPAQGAEPDDILADPDGFLAHLEEQIELCDDADELTGIAESNAEMIARLPKPHRTKAAKMLKEAAE